MARKGGCTTNVALACDHSCRVIFVAPGASGRCHDSTVLSHSHALDDLPPGYMWLADAGYALQPHVLTPYQIPGLRYHLKEWAKSSSLRPRNRKELFNLRHAQLRNAVERTFGQLKSRFRCIGTRLANDMEKNCLVIVACCIAHNFLKDLNDEVRNGERARWNAEASAEAEGDDHDEEFEYELDDGTGVWPAAAAAQFMVGAALAPAARRDAIATKLWEDYVAVMAARGVDIVEVNVTYAASLAPANAAPAPAPQVASPQVVAPDAPAPIYYADAEGSSDDEVHMECL